MPTDPSIFINGVDKTLSDSIQSMVGYNINYAKDMGTLFEVEELFTNVDFVNSHSITELKTLAMERIRELKKLAK